MMGWDIVFNRMWLVFNTSFTQDETLLRWGLDLYVKADLTVAKLLSGSSKVHFYTV